MIPVLVTVSIVAFLVIQLPPGDFVDHYVQEKRNQGWDISEEDELALRVRFGLDDPVIAQYFRWAGGILQGDFGVSLYMQRSVADVVRERFPLTALMSLLSFILVNLIAIPIGMLSATRQYSFFDYLFTVIGFLGLAVPNFIFAVVVMWAIYAATGNPLVGVMSEQFIGMPFSLAKLWDIITHLWLPALITATAGTAGQIRTMRANLLDEMEKPYVMVARAKGVPRMRMLYKYPFRMAMNPFVVGLANVVPGLLSGGLMVSLTLGLPTLDPVFLQAMEQQDMYMAATGVLLFSTLSLVGILLSDFLLTIVDPRIREAV
jgi:peptide/nickel transport system permease protein